MGMCKKCGEVVNTSYMVDGLCPDCQTQQDLLKSEKLKKFESLSNSQKYEELDKIILTTETYINANNIQRIGIVTAQRVYGMNIIKDLFSAVRDVVGGRVNNIETAMEDAKKEIEKDLKEKAIFLGANAIIGINIQHTFAGNNMLSFLASGTAVIIE